MVFGAKKDTNHQRKNAEEEYKRYQLPDADMCIPLGREKSERARFVTSICKIGFEETN